MKRILYIVMAVSLVLLDITGASAQEYRRANRKGSRAFLAGDFDKAIMHYDKALSRDTVNTAHLRYNKAYVYHSDRRDSTQNMVKDSLALEQLDKIAEAVVGTEYEYDYHFNRGVIAIDMKDWQSAVDEFKKCLIMDPDDMKARENYIYAKEHLKNQQNQQNQQDQQNDQNKDDQQQGDQDQQGDQNQQNGDQDQQQGDQNQNQGDQNKDDQQDQKDQQGQPQESKISPQAAKQILQAMQAKEKETQDKVEKKKAAAMKSKQKEKNW